MARVHVLLRATRRGCMSKLMNPDVNPYVNPSQEGLSVGTFLLVECKCSNS